MVSQGVACLRVGLILVAFGVHSMTALRRSMGTLQPLGVIALCSCGRGRLLVPSSMWVHARMELRSGAVFPPQLLAALWIRLLGDLRDCAAYAGRGLKCVSD